MPIKIKILVDYQGLLYRPHIHLKSIWTYKPRKRIYEESFIILWYYEIITIQMTLLQIQLASSWAWLLLDLTFIFTWNSTFSIHLGNTFTQDVILQTVSSTQYILSSPILCDVTYVLLSNFRFAISLLSKLRSFPIQIYSKYTLALLD